MKFSTHNVRLWAVLAVMPLAGCQRTGVAPVASTNQTPIAADEAMALRNWPEERALYASGAVRAYPTLFPFQPDERNPYYVNSLVEPALLVGQTLALPVTAVVTPPWTPVIYHGVYVGPTYTADVPLEPIP